MDDLDGIILHGSINGTLRGGATLIQGKINKALSTNGVDQAVRFGRHLEQCFHLPTKCTSGSSFAYWLKWEPTTNFALIFDTGGWYTSSHGYTHQLNNDGVIVIFVKDEFHYHLLIAFIGNQSKWSYIVQTWSANRGIKLYLNGCPLDNDSVKIWKTPRTHNIVIDAEFSLGEPSLGVKYRANMTLDHLMAWDDELTATEVWKLYVQSGQV